MPKSLEYKKVQALLIGLTKLELKVLDEEYSSPLELLQAIYEKDPPGFSYTQLQQFVHDMIYEHWSMTTLQEQVTRLQMSEEEKLAIVQYWEHEADYVACQLLKETNVNESLKRMRWRLDQTICSASNPMIHEPSVVLELALSQSSLAFEMNLKQLGQLVDECDSIEAKLRA